MVVDLVRRELKLGQREGGTKGRRKLPIESISRYAKSSKRAFRPLLYYEVSTSEGSGWF
jgi:hypothetical protein